VEIRDLNVAFGERVVYRDFSLSVEEAATTVILGPSGCGKTTLLNSIARSLPKGEGTSFIFQEPRLLPWYTVEKNISLVLNGSDQYKNERARFFLAKVGLANRLKAYPDELSGGERQRVAIARAFSFPSTALLMDEPFQSQDPSLKLQLIALVKQLQTEERRTVIAVTHDVREACMLADRAIVLEGKPARIALDAKAGPDLERLVAEALLCEMR